MFDTLWYEKYRPQKLDDMVLDSSLKKTILEFKEKDEIPHLLFVGSAGIGKTSIAKIIVNDILDCEYIILNASDEGGIETVRTKVKDFASSASLDERIKVIIFGEADGLTSQAQDSLKEIIEDSASTTRFIFTANDVSKLTQPIVSRCRRYDITYPEKDYIRACAKVLVNENVDFSKNKGELVELLKSCYPDFRRAIGEMQKNVSDGVFNKPEDVSDVFAGEIWGLIEDKSTPEKIRSHVIHNSDKFTNHAELMVEMIEYAYNNFDVKLTRKLAIPINEYIVKDNQHVNKEINFYCCVITIIKTLDDSDYPLKPSK